MATADEIYEDLLHQILNDVLLPGTRLPAERRLAAHYQTNRNTLREALHRLCHQKLVSIRHGQGVTIRDFRKEATLATLGPYLSHVPWCDEQARLVADLLRARLQILEMSLELAVVRATPDDRERLETIIARQLQHLDADDRPALDATAQELINAIVDAADSLAARWIANTILEVYRGLLERTPSLWFYDARYRAWLEALRGAFAARDPSSVVAETRATIGATDAQVIAILTP